MLKFYPPNVLALIKKIKVDQTNEMQTPLLLDEVLISDKHKQQIDIYSFGCLLLFLVVGGYKWNNTGEFFNKFVEITKSAKYNFAAESLNKLVKIIKKCLFLSKNEIYSFKEILNDLELIGEKDLLVYENKNE